MIPEPTSILHAELSLCGEQGLEVAGQKFVPDSSKAYAEIRLAHSWPVITYYGGAMHPAVLARHYNSMLHQAVNRSHALRFYDPANILRDRIVGSVVAVEFPPTPPMGWKLPQTEAEAPGIRAAVAIFKQAEWVDKFLGAHQAGRVPYAVSMEMQYHNAESGFMIKSNPGTIAPGWDYVPFAQATPELLATRDWKRGRMAARDATGRCAGRYQGADVYFLHGGLDGRVHFNGVGIVEVPAEPTARIARVLAGQDPDEVTALRMTLQNLRNILTTGPARG